MHLQSGLPGVCGVAGSVLPRKLTLIVFAGVLIKFLLLLTQFSFAWVQVLDAPALQDDFYLNLVDWSSQNVLAVGLGSCVYLWSACTSKASLLLHSA
jgi:hypothetical protein